MQTLFWLTAILGTSLALIYRRVDLKTSTAALGAILVALTLLSNGVTFLVVFLWLGFAALALLNVESLRRERISARILELLSGMLPSISKTEQDALEAGSVWWEGSLFSGIPDWRKLSELPAPELTEEEQAFLDGPTEELCHRLAILIMATHSQVKCFQASLQQVGIVRRNHRTHDPSQVADRLQFLAASDNDPG